MQNCRCLEFVNKVFFFKFFFFLISYVTFPKMVLQRDGNITLFGQLYEIGSCGCRIPALTEAYILKI